MTSVVEPPPEGSPAAVRLATLGYTLDDWHLSRLIEHIDLYPEVIAAVQDEVDGVVSLTSRAEDAARAWGRANPRQAAGWEQVASILNTAAAYARALTGEGT